MANPGSNENQQTFLRFINPTNESATVEVYGIDDGGIRSRMDALSFTLTAGESKQITAQDLENGNTDKGISGSLCDGMGKWQLRIRSNVEIRTMLFIRTRDGFLTSLNEVTPRTIQDNFVYVANPASNTNQQTFLRIVNTSAETDTVTITGVDDEGAASSSEVTFTLNPFEAKQVTSQDLEIGNTGKGLSGELGDGTGKWRLTVSSPLLLQVMSLIRTPDGFLTNLSSVVEPNDAEEHQVYFANPASETFRTSFLRIINTGEQLANVSIGAIDDTGVSGGTVEFALAANEAKQVTTQDLENGNDDKGLVGNLTAGNGRWRLTITADATIEVMSLIRTPDGFLTNLSGITPESSGVHEIFVFNPASNTNQRSSLRLINNTDQNGSVDISGINDSGAQSGDVTFDLGAREAITVTADDLENGNDDVGLEGLLGNGTGKWRLSVSADVELKVQNLLDTPTGFLTNLSRPVERHISAINFPDDALADCVANTEVIYVNELTNLSCFLQGVTDTTGLEELTALVDLDLSGNQLTSIDISANTALQSLNLSNNQLATLDASENQLLSSIDITDNDISCVDIEVIERDHSALNGVTHNADCGSNWEPSVFPRVNDLTALCASPREGINPANNQPYPDIQGRILDENNWLRSLSNLTYLWYDEIIDQDPGNFEDPIVYFDELRTLERLPSGRLKDTSHFTINTEAFRQYIESGTSSAGSYGTNITFLQSFPPRHAVVVMTEPGSPAAGIKLTRGARIMAVDGVDIVFGADIDTLNAGLNPATVGETHEFVVLDLDSDTERSITITSAEVTAVPVQHIQTIDTNLGKVGYFLFNDHIATAEQQLIDAINELKTAEVTDLVIDVRYNGGGLTAIARELSYMIGGAQTDGRTFNANQWNDQHPVFDPVTGQLITSTPFYSSAIGFSAAEGESLPTLDLNRVFVLTTSNSCSASELIMNSLRRVDVEVIQIGQTTCGKPYGFYGLDNCGTSHFTIQFQASNDKGFGYYPEGFSPSDSVPLTGVSVPGCSVADDLTHAFGNPDEAMLAAALNYRETGSCPGEIISSARRLGTRIDASTADIKVHKHPLLRNNIVLPGPRSGQ